MRERYYFPADDISSPEAGKDRSGWVSPVTNCLQLSYNKDSRRPSISNYMLDWGTLIFVALNKIEWASTHCLPGMLHGSCAALHCYYRKEGTFVTPTLTVQKTFSYVKAKKFNFLALFMGWSRCTRKTTQRNYFLLESQHYPSNSTLLCNPPLLHTDDLQSKFCYLPFFTQRCVCG